MNVSIKKIEISVMIGEYKDTVQNLTSGIGNNHHKGGQSQNRFHRGRKEKINSFFKRAIEHMNDIEVSSWSIIGEKESVKRFKRIMEVY